MTNEMAEMPNRVKIYKKNLSYTFIQRYTFIKLSKNFSSLLSYGAHVYLENQSKLHFEFEFGY